MDAIAGAPDAAVADLPQPGSLTVTKTITGPGAGLRGRIVIAAECNGQPLPDFVIDATDPTSPTPSHTYPDIPAGSRCTVSETDAGVDAGVTVQITGDNNHTVTIEPGAESTVHLTDTYNPRPGSLTVPVLFAGPAAGQQGPVTIGVSCTGGDGPFSDSHTVAAGTTDRPSYTFTGIPGGSSCEITEPETGAIAGTVTVSTDGAPQTVQVPAGQHVIAGEITNTYEFVPGSLTVTKTIEGAAAGQQGVIHIQVACNGTPLDPHPWVIAAGATGTSSHTFADIPAGSRCTVAEAQSGSSSGIDVTPEFTDGDGTVTIEPGTEATVGITNTVQDAQPGFLRVVKQILGTAAGSQGPVTIHVACQVDGADTYSEDFTIPAGSDAGFYSHLFGPMSAGWTCTVTETGTGEIAGSVTVTTTGSPQTVDIPARVDVGVEADPIIDEYDVVPGQLTVTKSITGPAAGRQGPVRIQVVCDGQALPDVVIPAGATGDQSHTFTDLPGNARCAVSEIGDGSTSTVTATVGGDNDTTVTVPPGDTASVHLTDTYDPVPGTLVVSTLIAGAAAGHQGPITMDVSCTLNGAPSFSDSVAIAAGATGLHEHGFDAVPSGSRCTVTETADGHTGTVTADAAVSPGAPVGIAANAGTLVKVLNTYGFVPGQLTVTKSITGPAAGDQGEVGIQAVCDGQALPVFVIPAGATGDHSHTFTGIAGNAECTVTEIADGATSSVTVTIGGDNGSTATVPPAGSASLHVTDRYEAVTPTSSNTSASPTSSSTSASPTSSSTSASPTSSSTSASPTSSNTSTSLTTPTAPTASTPTPASVTSTLPDTGVAAVPEVVVALAMTLAGAMLVYAGRRRTTRRG